MSPKVLFAIVAVAILIVLTVAAYESGDRITKGKECREIRYRLDCARAWQEYRINPNPGNRPLCDTGDLSIRESGELFNKAIELGCPAQ